MPKARKIRILVAEDDDEWGSPLREMYREVLDECELAHEVEWIPEGREAYLKLDQADRIHLLSLDLNLGKRHPTKDGKPDRSIRGANGLDLLKVAVSRRVCRGLVVPTGAAHDETVEWVVKNHGELSTVRISLDSHLKQLFGERYELLRKVPQMSVAEHIEHFRRILTPKRLQQLIVPENEFLRQPDGYWRLSFAQVTAFCDHTPGMNLIHHLLCFQGEPIHPTDLRGLRPPGEAGRSTAEKESAARAAQEFGRDADEGSSQEIHDSRAIQEQQSRIHQIQNELKELECEIKRHREKGDPEGEERLIGQFDALCDEFKQLKANLQKGNPTKTAREGGLHDEVRPSRKLRFSGTNQKLKDYKYVQPTIKRALEKIKIVHPKLGAHFHEDGKIETSSGRDDCGYFPTCEIEWLLE